MIPEIQFCLKMFDKPTGPTPRIALLKLRSTEKPDHSTPDTRFYPSPFSRHFNFAMISRALLTVSRLDFNSSFFPG